MCVPHKFDLADSSCVSNEVCSFSRKLEELVKPFNYTSVTQVERSTEFFLHVWAVLYLEVLERIYFETISYIFQLNLPTKVPLSI
jgi:hypothetical protein